MSAEVIHRWRSVANGGTFQYVDENNPLPVALDGEAITVETGPEIGTTPTDRSGTITTGGTAQTPMALNAARNEAWVQNIDATEDLWINITGGAAVVNGLASYRLPAGTAWAGKTTAAISVIAATTAHKFSAGER